jgi:hypothetical protein
VVKEVEMTEGSASRSSDASADRVSLEINAFIWFDRRDKIWRGLARELSLFAEGQSPDQVERELWQLCEEYVADAIEHDLVSEMIPRPIRRIEWLKLMAYGKWLSLDTLLSNLIHRQRNRNRPVLHRMISC